MLELSLQIAGVGRPRTGGWNVKSERASSAADEVVLQKQPSYENGPRRGGGGASSRCGPSSSLLPFQLLRMFFRQQDEIRRLKDELSQKDIRIRQLQLELKNLRNSPKNN